MKILVLGHGAVGSVLTKLLKKEDKVKAVICADINFSKEEKSGKMYKVNINLKNKKQLSQLIKKHSPDLVVNACSPKFNPNILEECTKSGINYLDMAAAW